MFSKTTFCRSFLILKPSSNSFQIELSDGCYRKPFLVSYILLFLSFESLIQIHWALNFFEKKNFRPCLVFVTKFILKILLSIIVEILMFLKMRHQKFHTWISVEISIFDLLCNFYYFQKSHKRSFSIVRELGLQWRNSRDAICSFLNAEIIVKTKFHLNQIEPESPKFRGLKCSALFNI